LLIGFIRPDSGIRKQKKIKIGYCPERVILPRFINVYDYLTTLARIKKSQLDSHLLSLFEIPLNQTIHHLSKGNMQKVALITAFLGNPDLIILDEPFSGLDYQSQLKFVDYLKEKQALGKSIMISTHQPKLLESIANKRIDL
jgi:ABC-2 type transport system ATP-binding protein